MSRSSRSHSAPAAKPGRRRHGPAKRASSTTTRRVADRRTTGDARRSPSARRVDPRRRPAPARQAAPRQVGRSPVAATARRRAQGHRPSPARSGRGVVAPPPTKRIRTAGSPQRRLRIALIVIGLVMVGIVGRVTYLQTQEAGTLRSAGANQWTRSYSLSAQRGTVFDRYGNELAMSVPAVDISINPKLIDDGFEAIQQLDNILDLTEEKVASLLREIESKERGFVYVARQVDAEKGEAVRWLDRAGINVDDVSRREMPGGDTGRSVIGRTNIDGEGIAGLELQYDELLSGTPGSMTREVDPKQRTIAGSEVVTSEPVPGDDLVLTLDRSIQFSTERVLIDQVRRIEAKGATAIVMDPATGEIYSMASVRRDAVTGDVEVTSGNFAAVDAYEPGSVAKVITIAGALDAGAVEPTTEFVVPWRKQYWDDLLSDSHQHPDDVMTVEQILVASSNIGTIMVQGAMGRDAHYEYMQQFGLGEVSALDFPSESPGVFKAQKDLWGSERVTVAYGQGMSATSIQLIGAINTIANGGTYVDPKLVRATVGPDGEQTIMPPSESRRVVSELAAEQTTEMMRGVVCRGTAKRAQVEGVPIAGKTGTAFKAAADGGYFNERGERIYYSSFVGFFPADDPQVTVLVSVDEPPAQTNDRFGGTAAAPVFAELVPTLIHELDVEPTPGSVGCDD